MELMAIHNNDISAETTIYNHYMILIAEYEKAVSKRETYEEQLTLINKLEIINGIIAKLCADIIKIKVKINKYKDNIEQLNKIISYNDDTLKKIEHTKKSTYKWQLLTTFITEQRKLILEYNQYIINMDIYSKKEQYDKIKKQWDDYNSYIINKNIKANLLYHLEHYESRQDELQRYKNNALKKTEYDTIKTKINQITNHAIYNNNKAILLKNALLIEHKIINDQLMEIILNNNKIKIMNEQRDIVIIARNKLDIIIKTLSDRVSIMTTINNIFDNLRASIYTDVILPVLCKEINEILYDYLINDCYITATYTKDQFNWLINSRTNVSPVKTAGGFREFIYGLAMRIALSNINKVSINCKQIFFDEGFVAGSDTNLQEIPELINAIAKKYDGVYLISHLAIIKECANNIINIDNTSTSAKMTFGKVKDHISVTSSSIILINICAGIKKNGAKCNFKAINGLFCKIHCKK